MLQRNLHELPPQRQHRFVATLQLHDIFARQIGKRRVFVKTHFGGTVELLQIGQLEGGIVFLLFHQIGHQHAELRAPVAHMVLADDFVPQKAQYARQAVADDGRTQVADVHFFGQVGR